jgi:hypothetical protein
MEYPPLTIYRIKSCFTIDLYEKDIRRMSPWIPWRHCACVLLGGIRTNYARFPVAEEALTSRFTAPINAALAVACVHDAGESRRVYSFAV